MEQLRHFDFCENAVINALRQLGVKAQRNFSGSQYVEALSVEL